MIHPLNSAVVLGALLAAMAATTGPAIEPGATNTYRSGFVRWRAADGGFAGWQLSGATLGADGALRLDPASARAGVDPLPPGGYAGRSFYNGGAFLVGEATGPVVPAGFAFREAIASWNAATPAGSWVEVQLRARRGGRWTAWYNLGVWAGDGSTVERHSVRGQADRDGSVAVDTLRLSARSPAAGAMQLRLRLFSEGVAVPEVRSAALAYSTAPASPRRLTPGDPARWDHVLDVPSCSQMVYPDGGEVWCSPTSVAMVLAYWVGAQGPCEPWVRAAVAGVYDWVYDGHGNWPFNVAYAATAGLEGYVTRLTSLAQAEEWVAARVPVIISYAWDEGELPGAPIHTSRGHLAVLVGFDAAGNPVVNDPAAAGDSAVRRTYDRARLERLWLEHSGGTAYLLFPPGHPTPAA